MLMHTPYTVEAFELYYNTNTTKWSRVNPGNINVCGPWEEPRESPRENTESLHRTQQKTNCSEVRVIQEQLNPLIHPAVPQCLMVNSYWFRDRREQLYLY